MLFIGKSSFGNTILGTNQFKALKSAISITTKCEASARIFHDTRLLVVDTPGFFDTELSPAELIPEICSSYQVAAPGPHAFLVVFSLDRFTIQEKAVAKWICEVFDERALDYCIIVFTGLDGIEKQNQTIEDFLKTVPAFLKDFINKCSGRYIAVNNDASDSNKEELTSVLMGKISTMVKANGGQFYNNKEFIKISEVLRRCPDWFRPVRSDGTVDLIEDASKIVTNELDPNTLFKIQG